RVERLCRREGLKAPFKQPRKGQLWLNDESCIRLKPECPALRAARGSTAFETRLEATTDLTLRRKKPGPKPARKLPPR
ncbi:MAG TPA: hypothetical protein QF813_03195, partial [Alphaproteobacteria bacterium]|nr:hypothetical protein [Alphaproteobacteria bacterium]